MITDYLSCLLVQGLILLILNEINEPIVYVYRALYPIVWISILLFSLGEVRVTHSNAARRRTCLSLSLSSQAARVTSKCDKFHRISLSMRVYGYHTCASDELDGFLLFVSKADLRAKLFGLTVRPGRIITLLVSIVLICVVLLQTNIINSPNFFFQ